MSLEIQTRKYKTNPDATFSSVFAKDGHVLVIYSYLKSITCTGNLTSLGSNPANEDHEDTLFWIGNINLLTSIDKV